MKRRHQEEEERMRASKRTRLSSAFSQLNLGFNQTTDSGMGSSQE